MVHYFKSNFWFRLFLITQNYSFQRIDIESISIHQITLDEILYFYIENKGIYQYNPLNETLQ